MHKPYLLLTGVLFLFVLLSCQRELDFTSNPIPSSFTANINGAAWDANVIKSISRTNGVIAITGLSSSHKRILMTVLDSGVQNYSFPRLGAANFAILSDSSSANPMPYITSAWPTGTVHGNLNITSIDTINKVMSGTFAFDAFRVQDTSSVTVTGGVFVNVPYTSGITQQTLADTFRAKINGVDFAYSWLYSVAPPTTALISITGSNGSVFAMPSLGLVLPDTIVAGTRPLSGFGTYVGVYNLNSSNIFGADSGDVVITHHDRINRRIRGTFGFRGSVLGASPPLYARITEGFFAVTYQ